MSDTASSSSSKRRKIELSWSEVIDNTTIQDERKAIVAEVLSELASPMEFSTMISKRLQCAACKEAEIEGWDEELCRIILQLDKGLPAPSNMKWSHVHLILDGNIPTNNLLLKDLPVTTEELKTALLSKYDFLNHFVANCSEADACQRVVAVLYFIFEQVRDRDILMECQPIISFTDFLIKVNSGSKSVLIKVKKSAIKTSLMLKTEESAQMLREAHIMITNNKIKELLFILTNSSDWSIGIAQEAGGNKIKVTTVKNFEVYANQESLCTVYEIIKKWLLG